MSTTFKPYNNRQMVKDKEGHEFDRSKAVYIPNEVVRNGITYVITHDKVYSKINGTLRKVEALPPDKSDMVRHENKEETK